MIRFAASVLSIAAVVAVLAPRPEAGGTNTMGAAGPSGTATSDTAARGTQATFVSGTRELVLDRAPDGHFYTDAQVGPATIHFLVDTGASTIALSPADAQAAGVQYVGSDQTGIARTPGGEVGLKRVTLDRVAIGPFETHDVDAAVVERPMEVSLLGQSWLHKVGSVTITGDKMVLR